MASPAPAVQSQCTVCYNPFDNNTRIPTSIYPCGHTFCEQCIKQVSICPIDQAVFDRTATNGEVISSLPASALAAQVKATSSGACSAPTPTVAVMPKNPLPEEDQPALREPSAQERFDQAMQCAPFNWTEAASMLEQIILMPDAEGNMSIKARARHYLAEFLPPQDQRITVLLEQVIKDRHAVPEHRAADRHKLALLYLQVEGKKADARVLWEHIASDPYAAQEAVAEACCVLAIMHREGIGGVPQSDAQAGGYYERVIGNPKATPSFLAEAYTQIGLFHVHGKGGYVQSDSLARPYFEQVLRMPAHSMEGDCRDYAKYWMGVFYREGRGGCEASDNYARQYFASVSREGEFEFHYEAHGWAGVMGGAHDLGYYLKKDISPALRKVIMGKVHPSREECVDSYLKIYNDARATPKEKSWALSELFRRDLYKNLDSQKDTCRLAVNNPLISREIKDKARLALALCLKEDPQSDGEVRALLTELHGAEVDKGVRKKALLEMALLVKANRGGENPRPLKDLLEAVINEKWPMPEDADAHYELALLLSQDPATVDRARQLLKHHSLSHSQRARELRVRLAESRCSIQ